MSKAPCQIPFVDQPVILIERDGDPKAGWTFDGWFLRPLFDRGDSLVFDGVELIDFHPLANRRWRFDGRDLWLQPGPEVLWRLEAGVLSKPGVLVVASWQFDGSTLEQVSDIRPDRWRADAEVPVLVMAFVAGLL